MVVRSDLAETENCGWCEVPAEYAVVDTASGCSITTYAYLCRECAKTTRVLKKALKEESEDEGNV